MGAALLRVLRSIDWKRWLDRLGPAVALVAIFAFFALMTPAETNFASMRNVQMIFRHTVVVGTAALGMTLVMILGGIDLSVGSVVALASVVVALVLQTEAASMPMLAAAAAAAGIGAGALAGAVNGALITRLKVVPFIVTLGMMGIVRGAAKALGSNQKVNAPASWLETLVAPVTGDDAWMLFPVGVWAMLGAAALLAAVIRFTRFGRHTVAIGSNEATARLCGVAVDRVKVATYAIMGAFAGVAGLMQFSRLTVGDPTTARGMELDVIAAVVIGGGSLSGGEGSVWGALVGALIMAVIRSGSAQMGWANWVQEIATGVIVVVAVALDRLRHRGARAG